MRVRHWILCPTVALLGLLSSLPAAAQGSNDTLQWSITPYLWTPGVKVDLALRDASLGGDIEFSDIIDKVDAAFMGHVEAGKGRFSGFADITYVDASDSTERTLVTIASRNEQLFVDAAMAWHPQGIEGPFNVFGGVRYAKLDTRYDFFANPSNAALASRRSSDSYYDALLGLRYRFELSERWAIVTRGDASFGDSEGSLLLRANFSYAVGKNRQNHILFGYQYKQMEFEDGGLRTDIRLAGPTAGFNFRF